MGYKHSDTQTDKKNAIEMGSGAMIYIPSFIKIDSGIQKLVKGGDRQTDRHDGDRIS
jgi:hypothetical protein